LLWGDASGVFFGGYSGDKIAVYRPKSLGGYEEGISVGKKLQGMRKKCVRLSNKIAKIKSF
jgi:hypothetical protein